MDFEDIPEASGSEVKSNKLLSSGVGFAFTCIDYLLSQIHIRNEKKLVIIQGTDGSFIPILSELFPGLRFLLIAGAEHVLRTYINNRNYNHYTYPGLRSQVLYFNTGDRIVINGKIQGYADDMINLYDFDKTEVLRMNRNENNNTFKNRPGMIAKINEVMNDSEYRFFILETTEIISGIKADIFISTDTQSSKIQLDQYKALKPENALLKLQKTSEYLKYDKIYMPIYPDSNYVHIAISRANSNSGVELIKYDKSFWDKLDNYMTHIRPKETYSNHTFYDSVGIDDCIDCDRIIRVTGNYFGQYYELDSDKSQKAIKAQILRILQCCHVTLLDETRKSLHGL